jgi:hypothetical protein
LEKRSREHRSTDRCNVQGFNSFGARLILRRDRNRKHEKNAPEGIGAMIGAMSKVSMISLQDLYQKCTETKNMEKRSESIGAMIGAMSKVLMVSVQDLY